MGLPDTQVKPSSPDQPYPLTWNGLHCSIPRSWESIVKNHSHLIFESKLSPVLEIRWEQPDRKIPPEKQLETLFARLGKEKAGPPTLQTAPLFLKTLPDRYQLRCYGKEGSTHPEGACMICRKCGTVILGHFFQAPMDHSEELSAFFREIDCHRHREQNQPWSVQDISFRLPDSFELHRFAFSYGLSRIEFWNKTSTLTLCRLAPASKHLESSSLGKLFCAFSHTDQMSHQVTDHYTLSHSSSHPGPGARLLARLGKKRPYTWSNFRHLEQADRILGISFASSAPLAQKQIDTIRDSYGIIRC